MEAQYRLRRDQLDRCLDLLEGAIERGEPSVTTHLADQLAPVLPAIRPGIPLDDAVDLVFSLQQELFSERVPEARERVAVGSGGAPDSLERGRHWQAPSCTDVPVSEPLTRAEAQDLTARIRAGLGHLPHLLLEAHTRRAWLPLGYRSWEQYVRCEFRLSRSRSYELLDQASVEASLRAAAGGRTVPPISTLAAIQVKSRLTEVVEEIREHVTDRTLAETERDFELFVLEAVKNARARARAMRTDSRDLVGVDRPLECASLPTHTSGGPDREDASRFERLRDAVTVLAMQPAATELVLSLHADELAQLAKASEAAKWLAEFAALLAKRPAISGWDVSAIPDNTSFGRVDQMLSPSRRQQESVPALLDA